MYLKVFATLGVLAVVAFVIVVCGLLLYGWMGRDED